MKHRREYENDTNETKRHMPCVLTETSWLLMALVRVLIRKTMKYTKPCCDSDDSAANRNLHSVCLVVTFGASTSTMKIDEIFQSHKMRESLSRSCSLVFQRPRLRKSLARTSKMVRFLGRRVRNASCPLHKKVMFL